MQAGRPKVQNEWSNSVDRMKQIRGQDFVLTSSVAELDEIGSAPAIMQEDNGGRQVALIFQDELQVRRGLVGLLTQAS